MKKWPQVIFILILVLGLAQTALAFYATSTNFTVQQKIQSISGSSTSSSFKLKSAGGQTSDATSSSSSFKGWAGILKFLYNPIKPQYEQIHYHWRNDDGAQDTATSATGGTEDAQLSPLVKNTIYRLRLEISNEGGTQKSYQSQQFRLEYGLLSTTCGAISSWTDVGAINGDFDMADSANLTDGANTTNIATSLGGVSDENKTFITSNGGVKDTSSQAAALSVPSDSFAELEYSIKALDAATENGTYCFRVTNANSTDNYVYTQYAQGRVAASAPSISFSLSNNAASLGALTPSSINTASTTLTVSANALSGYTAYISEDGDLRYNSRSIADVIDGTVTAGSEEFGLNTGYGDFISDSAITGGLKIVRSSGAAVTNENTTATYKASVSNNTPSGFYSQIITYVVVGNF